MGRKSVNKVWEYFEYISDRLAECQTCKARISTRQKATYNLKRHLYTLHGINTFLKGTHLDRQRRKYDILAGRWRPKKNFIQSEESETDNSNYYQSHMSNKLEDNVTNNICKYEHEILAENDENDSIDSHNIPVKNSPENGIYKVDPDDSDDGVRNFQIQDDPLSKHSIPASSVYTTTNPIKSSPKESEPAPAPTIKKSTPHYGLEKMKAEALAAKYKAEAAYFKEMADLTRSKRVYVDLECQMLRRQLEE